MSKHILLYTDDPEFGGVAHYNHNILLGLAHQGYQVTCVQGQSSSPLIEQQKQQGVQHIWLDFDTIKDFQRSLTDTHDPERIFQQAQPDLILFSDCSPVSNLAAKQMALQLGIPYVIVIGFVAPYLAERFTNYLEILSEQHASAEAVVVVSQENLRLLHELFGTPRHQGQVIHYGRPTQYFAPRDLAIRDRLRQELGIAADAVVCFTAARLVAVKGFKYQLEAIAQLKQTSIWSQLYFVWAGDGNKFEEIAQEVQRLGVGDRVKLLGHRWDIADWYEAADIFVLPSELEGMPLAVMEAMAKAVSVMASAVSGVPEELGDTGKLLPDPKQDPQGTIREMVTTIQAWAKDSELRDRLGQACKQRAELLFREERMIEETLNMVDRALLPPGDYVSPNFAIVLPDRAFPNMITGNTNVNNWPYLRREIPHNWYVDQRLPMVGFLSRDEAHILHNTALKFKGHRALEIGCWMGWSACHLALAGVELDVIDPLLSRSEFYQSVTDSLQTVGVLNSVNLIPGYSPQAVEELVTQQQCKWSLIFIDGNHEAPGPLEDAIACEQFAEPDALILFHDLAAPDVAQGLDYLKEHGWNTMIYQTMQIMGVAWRGNVEPVQHEPDPTVDWHLPKHLQSYAVSGLLQPPKTSPVNLLLDHLLQEIEQLRIPVLPALPVAPDQHQLANLHQQGRLFFNKGEFAKALTTFTELAKLNPNSVAAHRHLSSLHWHQGNIQQSLKHHVLAHAANTAIESIQNKEFQTILAIVQPYTLLSTERLFSLYCLAKQICLDDIPGNFVECGTYKGGSAALLAIVIKRYSLRPRTLYAFDTFEGMPEPTEIDRHNGVPANLTEFGAGTLKAPIVENLHKVCEALQVSQIVTPVAGLFAQTLPQFKAEIGSIALLHADGDWYASTMDIFNTLYESVVSHGFIQVDDYGFWEGCQQAIHDFERSQNGSFPLRVIDFTGVWFSKTDPADPNCNYWRTVWHLAQLSEKLNQKDAAVRAARAVLKLIPGLVVAEEMLIRLQTSGSASGNAEIIKRSLAETSAEQLLAEVGEQVRHYRKAPSHVVNLDALRQNRQRIAQAWLSLSSEHLEPAYCNTLGNIHRLLLDSKINNEPLTAEEQDFVEDIARELEQGFNSPQAINYLLVGMLYCRADQLPLQPDLPKIPPWFFNSYLQFMLDTPATFQMLGDAEKYCRYMQGWVDYLHSNIVANPASVLWQEVAAHFVQTSVFTPLYFNEVNLKDIYIKRAEIIQVALEHIGYEIEYQFPQRSPRSKMRLGILIDELQPRTETYTALPAFEYLDRNKFEIILYTTGTNEDTIAQYCESRVDQLVHLPTGLQQQVQSIRENDLDLLLLAKNVTAKIHPITLLVSHRLARIQATLYSSPATTGMLHMDYYFSGDLTEPVEGAEAHYREKLLKLEGTGYCFNYDYERPSTNLSVSRSMLGVSEDAIAFICGASSVKITPELIQTWAKILKAVPNSILILYPFAPSWEKALAIQAILQRMFEQCEVSSDRLILLDTLPTRADVKAYLKLADVYLDSYPYSGSHSTFDALQIGLPTVTMSGQTLRSRQGSALLRDLQLPELIVESEEAYINLAISLGTSPILRQQISHQIQQRMQQSPRFLDCRNYSTQIGSALETLFDQYQEQAIADLGLRQTNWIAFPAWNLPEEVLFEDLLSLLRVALTHPDRHQIALLINIGELEAVDADWAISSVITHLAMEEGIEVSDNGPTVLPVNRTSEVPLLQISARIVLEHENQDAVIQFQRAIAQAGIESIQAYSLYVIPI